MVLSVFRKNARAGKLKKNSKEMPSEKSPTQKALDSVGSDAISQLTDPLAGRIVLPPKDGNEENANNESDTFLLAKNESELLDQVSERIGRAKSVGLDTEACLNAITFHTPATQSEVLECLRTFGLAIFPSIYNPDRLSRIAGEYDDLIQNGADMARDIAAREETPANCYALSLLRDKLDHNRFPETMALFGSPTVKQLAEHFFAGQAFDFNHDLFVQWTDHTDAPSSGKLHWDKQLTFKSWLYVTDGTEEHGAMRAGAGTAAWMRYIREDAMFDGIPYGQIVNQVEEEGFPVVSTGGPAGTFFLFVTDTVHGASPVAEGKRRNIMRSRSRPHRVKQWANWASKL